MPKDCLVSSGSPTPQIELNAECFSVPVYVDKYVFYAKLKTLDYAAYKKMLAAITIYRSREIGKDVSTTNIIGDDAVAEIARANLIDVTGLKTRSGAPVTSENLPTHLAVRIGRAAAGNINKPKSSEDAPVSNELVIEDEGDTEEVQTEVTLADFDKRADVVAPVLHILKAISEADRQEYRKTSKIKSRTENGVEQTWAETNYDSVSKIYDRLALAVNGAVIDGKECVEGNKAAWVSKVPLPWKSFVLNEVFNRVESKNG